MFLRPPAPKAAIAASVLLLLAGCSLFEPSAVSEKKLGETVEVGLFEEGHVPRFELSVGKSEWRRLNENALALKEEYVPATLKIDGAEIGKVGVRYKGASTLKHAFNEGHRPSLKIKFDEYRGETRVDGMTRINLNGMANDDSMLRNRLAYRLFREMGVEAPRAGHAAVSVNGGPYGLYVMVENIDAAFVDDRWNSGDRDFLWKQAWPGQSRDRLALRWRSGPPFDPTGFDEFAEALETAAETGDRELFERYVDPEQALNYLAVDVGSGNTDGYRTWYCDGKASKSKPHSFSECKPHNFYWRQTPENRFTLIPWDLDLTFLVDPWLDVPEWNGSAIPCDSILPIDGNEIWYGAAECTPYFKALRKLYPEEWKVAMKRLVKGPMYGYVLERWLKEWKKEIEPFVDEDTLFHTVRDKSWWEKAYGGLTIAVGKQRQLMRDRLDGKLP